MKNITSITTLTLVAAAALADAAPAAAPASAWSQSANLIVTSNYVWRGVTQNNNSFALQGGFDYAHTSGLSVGVWGSSINSAEGLEADLYANYGFKVSNIDLSVGYIAYVYTGDSSLNFGEVNLAATYAGVTAKYSKTITGGSNYYYELGYTYSIPAVKGLDLGLHYGWAKASGVSTVTDYSVALTYPVAGFAATLAYSNGNSTIDNLYAVSLKKTF